ncbi:MAG: hypothetical protein ACLQRM_08885 [Acidimicrobiales bacterium]
MKTLSGYGFIPYGGEHQLVFVGAATWVLRDSKWRRASSQQPSLNNVVFDPLSDRLLGGSVGSQCFMSCSVTAYSAKSLRPQTGGFGGGGVDGLWVAVPDAGDLWFQFVGGPLECVSGKAGRSDASLRLPNTFSSQNIAEATPPGFVAADATNLIIAANETHGANPSESGIAVYALDPRCDA